MASMYKVDEIKLKVKVRLGEIAILMWRNKMQLSSLGVTGGECILGVKLTYMQMDLKLRGIYMNNHDPKTVYHKVMFAFSFTILTRSVELCVYIYSFIF